MPAARVELVKGLDAYGWARKIVVLLHDVPWKAFVVCSRPGRVLAVGNKNSACERVCKRLADLYTDLDINACIKRCLQREANDLEAVELISRIAHSVREAGFKSPASLIARAAYEDFLVGGLAGQADETAASLDRLIVDAVARGVLPSNPRHNPMCGKLVYVNMFDAKSAIVEDMESCERVIQRRVSQFVDELVRVIREVLAVVRGAEGIVRDADVLRLVYNMLFAIVEPLWYSIARREEDIRCAVVPADTRIPTHTIFDHLYSATAASNIVLCSNYLLIGIDVPSVQGFVAKGRKTRDYWAGSWLVSLLAWKLVEPFVEALGPDIVLSPALQLNPFYLAYLVELAGRLGGREAANMVSELLNRLTIAWRDMWPSQPLMPATVAIVVPACLAEEALRNPASLGEYLESVAGELLCRILREALRVARIAAAEDGVEYEWSDELEEAVNQACSSGGVKLPVRVVVVSAREVAGIESIVENVLKSSDLSVMLEKLKLAGVANRVRRKLRDIIVFHEAYSMLWHRLGSASALRLDDVFTTAVSPAYYTYTDGRYSSGRRWRRCTVCGMAPAISYRPRGSGSWHLIDEGEALCPICLAKRVIGYEPKIALLAVGFNYSAERAERRIVLSTRHLACAWSLPRRGARKRRGVCLPKYVINAARESGVLHVLLKTLGMSYEEELVQALAERVERLCEPPEDDDALRLCGATEYAAVRGDGDSIGSGIARGDLRVTTSEYFRMLGETLTRVYGDNRILEVYNSVGELVSAIVSRLSRLFSSTLGSQQGIAVKNIATIPLSPSYIYTFSRSLMATALVDTVAVEALGGVLVFSGGDDVYALAPLAAKPVSSRGVRVNPALVTLIATYALLVAGGDKRYVQEVVEKLGIGELQRINGSANTALLTVIATRLNYSGILDSWYAGRLNPGFHVVPGVITAAITVYGRSYAINVAHPRDSLWAVYAAAFELEEEKDNITYSRIGYKVPMKKDVVVVAYRRHLGSDTPIGVLPLRLNIFDPTDVIHSPAIAVHALYTSIGTLYTRSLIYDAFSVPGSRNPSETIFSLYWRASPTPNELTRLAIHLASRNARRGRSSLEHMMRVLDNAKLSEVVVVKGSDAKPLMHHVFVALRTLWEG